MKKKPLGRKPLPRDQRRKRINAFVLPETYKRIEQGRGGKTVGEYLDELVKGEK